MKKSLEWNDVTKRRSEEFLISKRAEISKVKFKKIFRTFKYTRILMEKLSYIKFHYT